MQVPQDINKEAKRKMSLFLGYDDHPTYRHQPEIISTDRLLKVTNDILQNASVAKNNNTGYNNVLPNAQTIHQIHNREAGRPNSSKQKDEVQNQIQLGLMKSPVDSRKFVDNRHPKNLTKDRFLAINNGKGVVAKSLPNSPCEYYGYPNAAIQQQDISKQNLATGNRLSSANRLESPKRRQHISLKASHKASKQSEDRQRFKSPQKVHTQPQIILPQNIQVQQAQQENYRRQHGTRDRRSQSRSNPSSPPSNGNIGLSVNQPYAANTQPRDLRFYHSPERQINVRNSESLNHFYNGMNIPSINAPIETERRPSLPNERRPDNLTIQNKQESIKNNSLNVCSPPSRFGLSLVDRVGSDYLKRNQLSQKIIYTKFSELSSHISQKLVNKGEVKHFEFTVKLGNKLLKKFRTKSHNKYITNENVKTIGIT